LAEKILSLKQKIGSVKLVPSAGGAFEITVNGIRLYSKLDSGEFPNTDAIMKAIREKL
jgi:selenoprotein W-related protein